MDVPKDEKKKPPPAHVNLKDIAEVCGLSIMTVSRALRDTPLVNPQTRERVLRTAREMGYVPNRLASSFGRQKTMTVGLVIPDIAHDIFPAVVKGIEATLNSHGYNLLLCCAHDRADTEFRQIQSLLERRIDGIILAPASVTQSREAVLRVQSLGYPCVFIDRIVPDLDCDSVTVDDFEGAFQMVTQLVGQSYTRIAHIAGPPGVWTSDERLRGYTQALAQAKLEHRPHFIVHGGFTMADGEAAMERLLALPERPDAVFCVNDPTAVEAFKVLRRHGLDVPRTIGLAGFSDILEAEIMAVPLTTVAQDAVTIGQQAAELLMERMAGTQGPPIRKVIKTRLVMRESSRRIPS